MPSLPTLTTALPRVQGAGVKICRTVGVNDVRVNPFLMLDELKLPTDQAFAGFPDHPVSSIETATA